MQHWLFYLVTILMLTACGNEAKDAQQAQQNLETEVMALHDEAMADMGRIYRLRRNLSSLRDTLQAQSGDTATISLLSRRIQELNDADEAMMDWMRRYQAPDTLAHEQAMIYLREEHEKMARVKTLMDSTISNAQKTYTQHGQK